MNRERCTVLVAQQLRRSRRSDLRPLLEQAPQHWLEGIELRHNRRSPVARRLLAPRQPGNRPPIDPQPTRDLPLRDPVRHQRPHLRPLQRAPHLRTSRSTSPIRRASKTRRTSDQLRGKWCTFRLPIPAQYWTPGVIDGLARVRRAGASGTILIRADSGFENKKVFTRLDGRGVQFSIGVKLHKHVARQVEQSRRAGLAAARRLPRDGGGGDRRDDTRLGAADRPPRAHPR